ncbi:MAG: tetratricopeptide repeat protein [Sandaracinaceae bacterium]
MLALIVLLAACGASQSSRTATTSEDPLDSISGEELFRRGLLLTRAGDFVRAEQYFAASMRNGQPEEQVLPALLRACIEGERFAAALQYAEPYLAQHPSQWSLRLLVATIYMGLEQHARAIQELERVIRDAPDEPPEAHYFLAVIYRDRLEDFESAYTHFQRYLELAPEGPHVEEAQAALPTPPRAPIRVDAEGRPIPAAAPAEPTAPAAPPSQGQPEASL